MVLDHQLLHLATGVVGVRVVDQVAGSEHAGPALRRRVVAGRLVAE